MLHWDILRRNFDVKQVDMILRHHVQYRDSLSGLPILGLECSKQDQLEREACQTGWKIGFFRGQTLMKWTEIFMEQSQPPGPSFPPGLTPRVLWHYALPCKTLSSRPKVARFCEGVKKARQGDYSTSKQNASITVGKSRPLHLDTFDDGHLDWKLWTAFSRYCWVWLGLRMMWTTKIGTAFSCYCWTFKTWTAFSCYCWQWSGVHSL